MPSSITLTVSHLAQSTSFFLSALQPLGYIYRGQACKSTIAFGPADPSVPPDFWLTQSTPSVPAGAAHVAFPAQSRQAVNNFFQAALKAGATIHGEPCVRDSHGYYSGAIIDFDGNSIEAVYRPSEHIREEAGGDSCTVVSRRSRSRAPSQVSRVPSTTTKINTSTAGKTPVTAHQVQKEPTKGDALDTILAQARSAADVAKQLVESVRPNLSSSTSTPAVPTRGQVHNTDAFAKAGETTNTVMGALLGVAAGAAVTYAITSRNSASSPSSDISGHDHKSKGTRPGLARSVTVPHLHHSTLEGRPHGTSHYIALKDNDTRSTTGKSTVNPDVRSRRRGSFDSAIGESPPSSTSTARSSRKAGQRMIEAPPPPSAYKAPASTFSQSTQSRSRSKTRNTAGQEHQSSRTPSATPRRSRSESRSRHASGSKHDRHDSGYSESGYETVLHVTTRQAYGSTPAHSSLLPRSDRQNEKDKPSKTWSSNKTLPLPMLSSLSSNHDRGERGRDQETHRSKRSASSSRSKASTATVRAEQYALPPSRAATWTDSHDQEARRGRKNAEPARASSRGRGMESLVSARSGISGARGGPGGYGRGDANTVIGKMRDLRTLRVREGEVRPEDSVSQVG